MNCYNHGKGILTIAVVNECKKCLQEILKNDEIIFFFSNELIEMIDT